MPDEPYLTAKGVARIIGKSWTWVRLARREAGKGPPYYKIGGRFLYREPEVMAWMRGKRLE